MKWFAVLLLCLLCSCGEKEQKRAVLKRKVEQNRYGEVLQKRPPQKPFLMTDSLFASQVWTYRYTDGVFPCTSDGGCVIKGFETDGKGRFYIVGGEPIRLACYRGLEQEFSRVISHAVCNSCLLTMRGDSLWFIEDSEQSILQIHKNGQGEILRHPIPLSKNDSIMCGGIKENSYVLTTQDVVKSAGVESHEEYLSWQKTWEFTYPNGLLRSANQSSAAMLYSPVKSFDTPFSPYHYMGQYKAWNVYLSSREYERAFIAVQKSGKEEWYICPLGGLPPISAVGVTNPMVGWAHSAGLDVFVNGLLYLSGYDFEKEIFQIHEFDIGLLCDKLEHRDK